MSLDIFDIIMERFDGAETCELIGIHLLHEPNKISNKNDSVIDKIADKTEKLIIKLSNIRDEA